MTGITLSEEERVQLLTYLSSAKQTPRGIANETLDKAIALITRDQATEFCECRQAVQSIRHCDEWWECGSCGKRIKETT